MAKITTPGYEGACFASGWYDELLSQVSEIIICYIAEKSWTKKSLILKSWYNFKHDFSQ